MPAVMDRDREVASMQVCVDGQEGSRFRGDDREEGSGGHVSRREGGGRTQR